MRLTLLLAVCLLGTGPVEAEQDAAAAETSVWGLPQLMAGMAGVKSSQRKFTERKYMSVLTTPLESSGTLSYRAPDRLEKHTLAPREERMVLEQGVIVVTRAGQGKRTMMVNQYPAIGAFVESIRSTLAGDRTTLERYFQVKLEGSAARWRMQLQPLDKATRDMVREIRMEGRGTQIAGMEIIEASGDRSVMTVGGESP